jgi:hypothetical protein
MATRMGAPLRFWFLVSGFWFEPIDQHPLINVTRL